ncbi:MAG: hypothetical protein PSV36_15870 [Algoriphagus sp.]|nr:hypothetical protein [Algoriphagus sp.]
MTLSPPFGSSQKNEKEINDVDFSDSPEARFNFPTGIVSTSGISSTSTLPVFGERLILD